MVCNRNSKHTMKIIIAGDNLTAYAIANALNSSQYDITLIGNNASNIKHIEATLDIQTVFGDYKSIETLEEAECQNANIIIAATQVPEIDILISLLATNFFQTPLTITILQCSLYGHRKHLLQNNNEHCQHLWINPTNLVTDHITNLIQYPNCQELISVYSDLCVIRIQVEKHHISHQKKAREIDKLTDSIRLISVIRKGIPLDTEKALQTEDQLIIACSKKNLDQTLALLTAKKQIKRIIIAGLSAISKALVNKLPNSYHVKIIESNIEKAETFAQTDSNVTILEGDINDEELLITEKIDQTDAFFSLSKDDEDNLVSALQAKRHGVSQIASLVHKPEIGPIIEENQIHCIDPHNLVINQIITHIHQDIIIKKRTLHRNAGEILCIRIPKNMNNTSIKHLKLPKHIKIIDLFRDNKPEKHDTSTKLKTNDTLAIYSHRASDLSALIKQTKPKRSLLDKLLFRDL